MPEATGELQMQRQPQLTELMIIADFDGDSHGSIRGGTTAPCRRSLRPQSPMAEHRRLGSSAGHRSRTLAPAICHSKPQRDASRGRQSSTPESEDPDRRRASYRNHADAWSLKAPRLRVSRGEGPPTWCHDEAHVVPG